MSTEIREWLNEIWEYCQEHWTVVAAGAAVVLVLLVSFFLILAAKRDDEAELDEPEQTEIPDAADPQPEESPAEIPDDGARGLVEQLMKHVEETSGAAGQKVESIELNIEKARLTIRYAGASEAGAMPVKEAEEPLQTKGSVCEDSVVTGEASAEETPQEMGEPAAAEESVKPKKFGVENMNRARSGRVYTEEELLNQIRD